MNNKENITEIINNLGEFYVDDIEITNSIKKRLNELVKYVSTIENISDINAYKKIMSSDIPKFMEYDIIYLLDKSIKELYEHVNPTENKVK